MAVGRKKSRARRDQGRSHHQMTTPTLSIDSTTGETHRRHHITPNTSKSFGAKKTD